MQVQQRYIQLTTCLPLVHTILHSVRFLELNTKELQLRALVSEWEFQSLKRVQNLLILSYLLHQSANFKVLDPYAEFNENGSIQFQRRVNRSIFWLHLHLNGEVLLSNTSLNRTSRIQTRGKVFLPKILLLWVPLR